MYLLAVTQADKTMFFMLCVMLQGEFLWPISFRKCLYGSAIFNVVMELGTSGFLVRCHLHVNLGFWRDYWIIVRKQEEAAKANGLAARCDNTQHGSPAEASSWSMLTLCQQLESAEAKDIARG